MEIDPAELKPGECYKLLIACVVPRPIAWVSSLSADGIPNLAPFSFFGGVTAAPPTVMVSIGRRRRDGTLVHKDTSRNLLDNGEAVIHIAHRPLAESMVASSAEVTPDVDEFDLVGLDTVESSRVAPRRLTDAAIAMESRVVEHIEVGRGPVDLFLLEMVHVHLRDELVVDGLPDPARLAAVGRLGGAGYCDTSVPFEIQRPS